MAGQVPAVLLRCHAAFAQHDDVQGLCCALHLQAPLAVASRVSSGGNTAAWEGFNWCGRTR